MNSSSDIVLGLSLRTSDGGAVGVDSNGHVDVLVGDVTLVSVVSMLELRMGSGCNQCRASQRKGSKKSVLHDNE